MAVHLEQLTQPLAVGPVRLKNRVFLAPMSGVTDAPFRRLAWRLGAGLVFCEMIASEALAQGRRDVIGRTESRGAGPVAIQLAGREARWMGEGARVAAGLGADIIDINMGCPARNVTNGLSGSALMRDLDHALGLIEATVAASPVPVTLKMRLGWDETSFNAPELARRAEEAGVQMITVHGRTRCQFFTGRADWRAIRAVKAAVCVPVVANGDLAGIEDAETMLEQSGADAVMVGRASLGQPWLPGVIARAATDRKADAPCMETRRDLALAHYDDTLVHYGAALGGRVARKHLAAYVDHACADGADARRWRGAICREENPARVAQAISAFFAEQAERVAA